MAKRAVLVGINKYAQPGANLRGCVNDVIDMKAVLTQLYGFADADVTTLLDEQATQAAMQTAITDLVASGESGDVLVLHYSGHGSHVRDVNGDEDDMRDEVLCPHDMSWDTPFLDDWLRTSFDKLAEGVNLTVVMDCCHSGSNTRAFDPPDAPLIPRYLPNPQLVEDGVDLDDELASRSGSRAGRSRSTSPRRRRRGNQDVHIVDLSESLITGCRDTQTSADARIDGTFHGALTYYLVAAIRELGAEASYRQIHARTLQLLDGEYEQVPQLEGRKEHLDSPFLSVRV
jgi:hypothetical protein